MVEEADAGRRAAGPAAVEREREARRRSRGRAVDLGRRVMAAISRMAPPSTRRGRGSPRRARARRPRAPGGAAAGPITHLSHAPPEVARRQRGREARGAARGQHVVGARHVVAEGGRARGADEHAAGGAHARRERLGLRADELEVLGRDRFGEGERRRRGCSVHEHEAARRRTGRADASQRPELAAISSRRSAEGETAITGLSGPCSAWASRSSATRRGVGAGAGITTSSLGPAIPSMPTWPRPGAWPPGRRRCPARRSRRRAGTLSVP